MIHPLRNFPPNSEAAKPPCRDLPPKEQQEGQTLKRAALLAALSGIIISLYLFWGFRVYTVQGESMAPLLGSGSRILVNRWAYGVPRFFRAGYLAVWKMPGRNDIMTFYSPLDGALSVKRCAARGKDHLELRHDTFYVNGEALPRGAFPPAAPLSPGILERRQVFLVGDNASASLDSRYFGPVSLDRVVGRVINYQ
ncbi:MAG: signal peptidase I [Spirochaetales bacterium]|jgi:signal peptidase I|nr:signal peptidase I [Spirochaetales bacterium]